MKVATLKLFARRPVCRVALSNQCQNTLACFFSTERVPDEDYYDGHLITDHLEYLDDMLDKTLKIETSMQRLQETYARKREAYQNSSSTQEMEALFDEAALQKREMSSQIENLKTILQGVQNIYAVDAPDGTSDTEVREGLSEVKQIIDFAATHEDVEMVKKHHKLEEAVKKERARDPEHDW